MTHACLILKNTISEINKSLNKDLKELSFWLNANKIALNISKAEVKIFKNKHKPCDAGLRLKQCRKRLNRTNYVSCLGIKIYTEKFVYMILPQKYIKII